MIQKQTLRDKESAYYKGEIYSIFIGLALTVSIGLVSGEANRLNDYLEATKPIMGGSYTDGWQYYTSDMIPKYMVYVKRS